MKIDIVITTYNRPSNVTALVNQLTDIVQGINTVIVVDSSDHDNLSLKSRADVVYLHSSHKNQPYQRYLGVIKSNADWVLFLDDDLEIIEPKFLQIFHDEIVRRENLVGIGSVIHFPGQPEINKSRLTQTLLWFTGVPRKQIGKLSLFGEFGGFGQSEFLETEVLSGGCMVLKKDIAKVLFSDVLFSIFEKRWAMGEDKYLSFKASELGRVLFLTKPYIAHPPIESTYFINASDFQSRVLFSRLWLAQLIGTTRGYSKPKILIHFIYYATWRILISGIQGVLGNTLSKEQFKGNLTAIKRILRYGFDSSKITPEIDWESEINKDVAN